MLPAAPLPGGSKSEMQRRWYCLTVVWVEKRMLVVHFVDLVDGMLEVALGRSGEVEVQGRVSLRGLGSVGIPHALGSDRCAGVILDLGKGGEIE